MGLEETPYEFFFLCDKGKPLGRSALASLLTGNWTDWKKKTPKIGTSNFAKARWSSVSDYPASQTCFPHMLGVKADTLLLQNKLGSLSSHPVFLPFLNFLGSLLLALSVYSVFIIFFSCLWGSWRLNSFLCLPDSATNKNSVKMI